MRRHLTIRAAEAHAQKHGYRLEATVGGRKVPGNTIAILGQASEPRRGRMNKTEQRFAAILETRKLAGEIDDWKFEGMSLRWGYDPDTGRPMLYTPDFVVFNKGAKGTRWTCVVEVKGPFIRQKDKIRYRGCKAEWGRHLGFQMWQEVRRDEWKLVA